MTYRAGQSKGFSPPAGDVQAGWSGAGAGTALRLARYFGTSAEMWTGLQADYELRVVRYDKARTIEREVLPLAA